MLIGRLSLPPAVLLASSVLVSASNARMKSSRLDTIAKMAEAARPQALRELAVGQKTGHWIWWLFPTLAVRGGDMFSMRQIPGGADLQGPSEAASYIAHEGLRAGLLNTLKAADSAFAAADSPAPYSVLDKGFGRSADGVWINGPVDAYKCWCSCSLFAAVAHKNHDVEVRDLAVKVLGYFQGEIKYTPSGPGTAGHVEGVSVQPTYVLKGADERTLAEVGGVTWREITAAVAKDEV